MRHDRRATFGQAAVGRPVAPRVRRRHFKLLVRWSPQRDRRHHPPDDRADAAFWTAVALARGGRSADAIAAFRNMLGGYPNSPRAGEASAMLGWLLVDAHQLDEAAKRFARDDARLEPGRSNVRRAPNRQIIEISSEFDAAARRALNANRCAIALTYGTH
jgi:hypothetical protein